MYAAHGDGTRELWCWWVCGYPGWGHPTHAHHVHVSLLLSHHLPGGHALYTMYVLEDVVAVVHTPGSGALQVLVAVQVSHATTHGSKYWYSVPGHHLGRQDQRPPVEVGR